MRKQQLTQFVSLLVLVVVGAAAAAQTPSQLDRVNVVRGTDDIRVEMSSRGTVTPKLSTLDSPARIVVDLPQTGMAPGQRRIAVGAAGVKSVRIGEDGQTPPTTRIGGDLDQACTYDLTPGPAGKLVLTLHGSALAQSAPAAGSKPAAEAPAEAKQAEAKTVAANSSAPAPQLMSPFAPRVLETKSAPKVEDTPAKPVANSAAPSDFVFVEPS